MRVVAKKKQGRLTVTSGAFRYPKITATSHWRMIVRSRPSELNNITERITDQWQMIAVESSAL